MYPLYCLIPSLICKNKHIDIIEYRKSGFTSGTICYCCQIVVVDFCLFNYRNHVRGSWVCAIPEDAK